MSPKKIKNIRKKPPPPKKHEKIWNKLWIYHVILSWINIGMTFSKNCQYIDISKSYNYSLKIIWVRCLIDFLWDRSGHLWPQMYFLPGKSVNDEIIFIAKNILQNCWFRGAAKKSFFNGSAFKEGVGAVKAVSLWLRGKKLNFLTLFATAKVPTALLLSSRGEGG